MAVSLEFSATERGYLLDAIDRLAGLSDSAPQLLRHVQSSFATCRGLCEMRVGVYRDDDTEEDFWREGGGSGDLDSSEAAAMRGLAVALRRVVNGCEGAPNSFRRSIAASVRLAERFVNDEIAGSHLKVVTG